MASSAAAREQQPLGRAVGEGDTPAEDGQRQHPPDREDQRPVDRPERGADEARHERARQEDQAELEWGRRRHLADPGDEEQPGPDQQDLDEDLDEPGAVGEHQLLVGRGETEIADQEHRRPGIVPQPIA